MRLREDHAPQKAAGLQFLFFFLVAGGRKEGALMIRLAPNAQGQRGKDEKADPSEGFRKRPAEEEAGRQTVLIKSVMSWGLGAKNAALLKKTNPKRTAFSLIHSLSLFWKNFMPKQRRWGSLGCFGFFFCNPKVLTLQVRNNWKWEISK